MKVHVCVFVCVRADACEHLHAHVCMCAQSLFCERVCVCVLTVLVLQAYALCW